MQQQMANAHTWFRTHLCLGLGFFLPSFPALHACAGLAGSLLLCTTPLLATASIPLPRLLGEFANIRASAQEAAHAAEFTLAHWAVREDCKWRWKPLGSAGSLSCFFWGLLWNSLFVLFPPLPSTSLCFFWSVWGCKMGRRSVREWGEKTLLTNF